MRVAVDTNVLVYAEGLHAPDLQLAASTLLQSLPASSVVLPVQVLGELFTVLVRKAKRTAVEARAAVMTWRNHFATQETSEAGLLGAIDLCVSHQLSLWDAVILSAAAEANCHLLLSEDMQDGFIWKGVTIANPFARKSHPLLIDLLNQRDRP